MARKFSWRDFRSLPGLNNQKLVLDNVFRFVYNPGLFSNSLLSIIFSSSGFYSSVVTSAGSFMVGQFYLPAANPTARLVHLASVGDDLPTGFSDLFSHLCQTAGEKGALQLTAEVDENSPGEDILMEIGFRRYAEQQIWMLPRRSMMNLGTKAWMPTTRGDADEIVRFYQRVVPGSILRVEPPPDGTATRGLVCWTEGRISGFAKTQFGPKGILVDLLLAPDLTQVEDYLSALIFHMPYRETRAIYLRIRSHQTRLAGALEMVGAEAGPQQKALVKRLAVHYNAKQAFRVQSFENQPDVTTPISNSKVKN